MTKGGRATRLVATLLVWLLSPALALAVELAPYKDDLFAYPKLLSQDLGGDYRVFDYREWRDINQRDAIPERRVKDRYVSLGVRDVQRDLIGETPVGRISHFAVGTEDKASLIVVYIHGQGGSRFQGVDDYTFGGNFNRVKNLVADAGGLYLVPDFSDFEKTGISQVAALVASYAARSPNAPLVVACGSAGGAICWGLANDPAIAKRLSGLMLLGSFWDESFLSSPAFRRRVPVFFAQGSRDKVFAVEKQEAFFRAIRAAAPGYPTRFVRFESGTHGTPIRMTDWREALNWIVRASR